MHLVILESPYAGTSRWWLVSWWQRRKNVRYARRCVRDSLLRGEAPIASHLLYTQPSILSDASRSERKHGIEAGLAWGRVADQTVVYSDRGISTGMRYGIEAARQAGRLTTYRFIEDKICVREIMEDQYHGTYVGLTTKLEGHTATIRPIGLDDYVIAQFDHPMDGLKIGWNGGFRLSDFKLDPKKDIGGGI